MKKRSNPANARYWLLVHRNSLVPVPFPDRPPQLFGVEEWHEFFKREFIGMHEIVLPNGRSFIKSESSSELGIDEFSDFMEQVEALSAERGVFLDELE